MKVIDLLNMISKGEEVPSPIYHNDLYYDFEDGDYFNQKTRNWLFNDSDIETILNDEVEIIEEDKKIEKIDLSEWAEITYSEDWQMLTKDFNRNCNLFVNRINEIIDYINKER